MQHKKLFNIEQYFNSNTDSPIGLMLEEYLISNTVDMTLFMVKKLAYVNFLIIFKLF